MLAYLIPLTKHVMKNELQYCITKAGILAWKMNGTFYALQALAKNLIYVTTLGVCYGDTTGLGLWLMGLVSRQSSFLVAQCWKFNWSSTHMTPLASNGKSTDSMLFAGRNTWVSGRTIGQQFCSMNAATVKLCISNRWWMQLEHWSNRWSLYSC